MVECPKCHREIKSLSQWHNCVTVSVDSLFEGKNPELMLTFDKILSEVADWDGVAVSTTQNCIVFVHRQTFLIIRPMAKVLDLKFYSSDKIEDELVIKSTAYSGRFENHIRQAPSIEIKAEVFSLLRKSYELL